MTSARTSSLVVKGPKGGAGPENKLGELANAVSLCGKTVCNLQKKLKKKAVFPLTDLL